MFGILNVYKPAGCTSRDVANRVQRLVRPAKVGHAGTLDPIASGVLVVCLGPATRLVEYVQRMPKAYRAVFLLGRTSPTDDVESEATELPGAPVPTREQVEAALPQFVGRILQTPPAYSAVKLKGRRAYELARKGEEVQIEPRTVTVHSLQIAAYESPELTLEVRCGSGTYVRSLGRDLARSLGTGAVMSALERTAVGVFHSEDAVDGDALNAAAIDASLLPPQMALSDVPHRELTPDEVADVMHGRFVGADNAGEGEFAGIDPAGRLVAILQNRGDGLLRPVRVFPQSE